MARAISSKATSSTAAPGLTSRLPGVGSLIGIARHYWLAVQHEHIPLIGAVAVGLLLIGAGTIYVLEVREGQESFPSLGEALWFGIVTMTTVGYGDFTPHTGIGRILAAALMLSGMTMMSLFTATLASLMVANKIRRDRKQEVIERMNDHVLVCGWNQHAERVLEGLFAVPGEQVVLVNEMPVSAMSEVLLRYHDPDISYTHGDPAHEAVLNRAHAERARAAIVLADASRGVPSDERTTLVTLALKSLKGSIKVTAEALDTKSEAHLRRAGADEIVITGEFNSFLLSSAATVPGISDVVRGVLSRSGAGLRSAPIPAEYAGRTFGELFHALHSRRGFLTLAIVTEKTGLSLDDLLTDDYSLVDKFIKQQFNEAGMDFLRFEQGGIRVLVNPSDDHVISAGDTAIGIPRAT
ncbi:MAG: NAD-binding protein [Chloroflexi bacterium]|nr:NAD-binding protein [Chloroflexota bacterium]